MPFGLKNAGATYQRLVNAMFADQLGRTMEVYIDDMLVKSLKAEDHIGHLSECFKVLRQHNMRLNPSKCSFGISSGKFLGYIVTQRGIEANPDQIRAIMNVPSPKNKREIQKLTGRIAALNSSFLDRPTSANPFSNCSKRIKSLNGTSNVSRRSTSLRSIYRPLLFWSFNDEQSRRTLVDIYGWWSV